MTSCGQETRLGLTLGWILNNFTVGKFLFLVLFIFSRELQEAKCFASPYQENIPSKRTMTKGLLTMAYVAFWYRLFFFFFRGPEPYSHSEKRPRIGTMDGVQKEGWAKRMGGQPLDSRIHPANAILILQTPNG